jgi:hypothetical protein
MPNNSEQKGPHNERLDCGEKIAGWEKLKALVLDSVSSPIRTAPMPTWAKLAIDA